MKTSITAALVVAALLGSSTRPAFAAPLPPDQEAVIQQEVRSRMRDCVAAIERADFAASWTCIAEVPGFQWVDIDGKAYGFADTKKSWEESMGQCRSMRYPMLQERVIVHGPDTATYVTNCTGELTLKDGTVLTRGTFTFSGLLQRMDGTWKIVFCQESSLPPQPVVTAPAGAAGSETTRAVLATLDEAFLAVNALDKARYLGFFVAADDLSCFEDKTPAPVQTGSLLVS